MAKGLNKVQIIGYLGADPEMRYTQQGTAITNLRVAVSRSWKGQDGELQEETEWFRITAFEKLAEICNQYLNKGSRVYVEGRLQTRKYTDKEGVERYSTEVVMQEMIMLDGRRDAEEAPAPAPAPRRTPLASPRPGVPSRNQPQPIGSDDDIPF